MQKDLINFIRDKFTSEEFIPLHVPTFNGNEKKYLEECIDSTFVSSVGAYVDKFENLMNKITHTQKTTAVVNGTAAIQVALRLVGVKKNDEVLSTYFCSYSKCNCL